MEITYRKGLYDEGEEFLVKKYAEKIGFLEEKVEKQTVFIDHRILNNCHCDCMKGAI